MSLNSDTARLDQKREGWVDNVSEHNGIFKLG